ncbi:MAG: hypothetical protein Q9227_002898 [Pyrenula ochraceoflavens]
MAQARFPPATAQQRDAFGPQGVFMDPGTIGQTAKDAAGTTKRIVDSTISKDETEDPKTKEYKLLARLNGDPQSFHAEEGRAANPKVSPAPMGTAYDHFNRSVQPPSSGMPMPSNPTQYQPNYGYHYASSPGTMSQGLAPQYISAQMAAQMATQAASGGMPGVATPQYRPMQMTQLSLQAQEMVYQQQELVQQQKARQAAGTRLTVPSQQFVSTQTMQPQMGQQRVTYPAQQGVSTPAVFQIPSSRSDSYSSAPSQAHEHALQDYQMQMMLLEQQNKKRLLMARQEQNRILPINQKSTISTTATKPGAVTIPAPKKDSSDSRYHVNNVGVNQANNNLGVASPFHSANMSRQGESLVSSVRAPGSQFQLKKARHSFERPPSTQEPRQCPSKTSPGSPRKNESLGTLSRSTSSTQPIADNVQETDKLNQNIVGRSAPLSSSRQSDGGMFLKDVPSGQSRKRTSKLPILVQSARHLSNPKAKNLAFSLPFNKEHHDKMLTQDFLEEYKRESDVLAKAGIQQLVEQDDIFPQQKSEQITKPRKPFLEAQKQKITNGSSIRKRYDNRAASTQLFQTPKRSSHLAATSESIKDSIDAQNVVRMDQFTPVPPSEASNDEAIALIGEDLEHSVDVPAEAARLGANPKDTKTKEVAQMSTRDFQSLSSYEVDENFSSPGHTAYEPVSDELLLPSLHEEAYREEPGSQIEFTQDNGYPEQVKDEGIPHNLNRGPELRFAEPQNTWQPTVMPESCDGYHHSMEVQELQAQIAMLQQQVVDLSASGKTEEDGTHWPVLHRVHCLKADLPATYIDCPILVRDGNHRHFDGRRRIADEAEWEENQGSTPFVVYLNYHCLDDEPGPVSMKKRRDRRRKFELDSNREDGAQQDDNTPAEPRYEEIHILSTALKEAVAETFYNIPSISAYLPLAFVQEGRLVSPYIFHYQHSAQFRMKLIQAADDWTEDFERFLSYLQTQTELSECEANELFCRGIVTPQYIPYLFLPGRLLVRASDEGLVAVEQHGIINCVSSDGLPETCSTWCPVSIGVNQIQFDGQFWTEKKQVDLVCEYENELHVKIKDLPLYPLMYAAEDIKDYLRERGQFFFSCRNGRYVVGPSQNDDGLSDVRYMVDVLTYQAIHDSKLSSIGRLLQRQKERLIEGDENDDRFILRLPPTIKGFHMHDKKWVTLPVDKLVPVDWNEEAFTSLAVDDDTKELVEALVTNKIEADKGTDLVAGKGSGLIMLLHG